MDVYHVSVRTARASKPASARARAAAAVSSAVADGDGFCMPPTRIGRNSARAAPTSSATACGLAGGRGFSACSRFSSPSASRRAASSSFFRSTVWGKGRLVSVISAHRGSERRRAHLLQEVPALALRRRRLPAAAGPRRPAGPRPA